MSGRPSGGQYRCWWRWREWIRRFAPHPSGALRASKTGCAAFCEPATWLLFPATAHQYEKTASRRFIRIGGGGGNGTALARLALRASVGRFAASVEPIRFSPKKKGPPMAALNCWWRWRESNSRPQALCSEVYMLIPSLVLLWATRRAGKTHSQFGKDLTVAAPNKQLPRSRGIDPWDPDARARAGQRALGWFLSS